MLEEKLKELIIDNSGNMKEFSRRAGLSYTTLRSILERGILNSNVENVLKILKTLGIDPNYIELIETGRQPIHSIYNKLKKPRQQKVYDFATQQLEEQNNIIQLDQVKEVDYKEVALFGCASAGTGQQVFNNPIEWASVPADIVPDSYDVALKVVGDSMGPAFEDGEYIFINQTQDVRSGQFVVVIVDDEVYLKKIYISDDSVRLVSLNKDYDDIVVDSTSELNIVGTVVL